MKKVLFLILCLSMALVSTTSLAYGETKKETSIQFESVCQIDNVISQTTIDPLVVLNHFVDATAMVVYDDIVIKRADNLTSIKTNDGYLYNYDFTYSNTLDKPSEKFDKSNKPSTIRVLILRWNSEDEDWI